MQQRRSMRMILFRLLRKYLVGPLTRWYRRQTLIQQLEQLAELGPGVIGRGPWNIGNPRNTFFAEDVSINPGFVSKGKGKLTVGAHVHMGEQITVITDNHNFKHPECLPYDPIRVIGDVTIGECVWIGDRVIILPGITVGDGAILAAGAIITRDVPPMSIVGGNPAKVIGQRDEAHFRSLRNRDRYLSWPRDYDLVERTKMVLRRRNASSPLS